MIMMMMATIRVFLIIINTDIYKKKNGLRFTSCHQLLLECQYLVLHGTDAIESFPAHNKLSMHVYILFWPCTTVVIRLSMCTISQIS